MPLFECARCNDLSYSAARTTVAACARCGAERRRVLEDVSSFEGVDTLERKAAAGDHCCVVYHDVEEVADLCAEFVSEGIAGGDRVMSHAPPALWDAIEERLGRGVVSAIPWLPPADVYGAPFDSETLVGHYVAVAQEAPSTVRVIGGPDRDVSSIATPEAWRRHEQRSHEAAVEHGLCVICVYDAGVLTEEYVHTAHTTHPLIATAGAMRRSASFEYEAA